MHRRTLLQLAARIGAISPFTSSTAAFAQDDDNPFEGIFVHGVKSLPEADEKSVAAVVVGEVIDDTLACILHNNTAEEVVIIQILPVLDGETPFVEPYIAPYAIAAGGYALATIYIDGGLEEGTVLELELISEPAEGSMQLKMWGYKEATITELEQSDRNVEGSFEYTSDSDFAGNTTVMVVFLDDEDQIVGFVSEYAETRDVAMQDRGEFDLTVMHGKSTDRYLAVAQGKAD